MSKRRPRSIVWRLYAFAALIVVMSLITMVVGVVISGDPPVHYQVPAIAALAQQLEVRYPDHAALATALGSEVTLARLDIAVFDRQGQLIGASRPPPPVPSGEELRIESGAPQVGPDRIVLAMGTDRIVVYRHDGRRRGEVIGTVLAITGGALVIALAATFAFARTLARPLRALGDAARAFGRGETGIRTNLSRRDELGAVGSAFDDMASKIEQLLRTQRAMMADISHELRTPLTRIKLALDLANADPHGAQQVLDDVGADLEEVEQIIEDVFVVVRLDSADTAAIRRKEVDLVEMVHHAAGRFEAHHPRHPLTVELGTIQRASIRGDAALLRRSLDNLLDNAAKYSVEGAPIVLRLEQRPDAYVVEVVDRGFGMSTSEVRLAFTPFWRADESRARETGGVGLGLALARRIARAHGGDVELESSRSEGTTARLTMSREHSDDRNNQKHTTTRG